MFSHSQKNWSTIWRIGPGSSGFRGWGLGFLDLKRLEIEAKFGGVCLGEIDWVSERRLIGEIGFWGLLNQFSKGLLKLIDAILREREREGFRREMKGFRIEREREREREQWRSELKRTELTELSLLGNSSG